MAIDENQGNSPAKPGSDSTDSSQQSWLELDQQGLSGETLKAKKWTTERRLVDNNQYVGNIHTGTEQDAEFNKDNAIISDISVRQPDISNNDQDFQPLDNQLAGSANTFQTRKNIEENASSVLSSTENAQHLSFESTIASRKDNTTPDVETHYDEPADGSKRSSTEQDSRSSSPVTPPVVELDTTLSTEEITEKVVKAEEALPTDPTPTATTLPEIPLEVERESDASPPVLNAADAHGSEDSSIAIEISSHLTDTDGSEVLTIIISGVPQGASLSAGTNMGGGTWRLDPSQLNGLSLSPPANSDEAFSLTITATSTESHGGQRSSVSEVIDVFIEAVADAPILAAKEAQGNEDTAISLDINPALSDTDGSETLSVITVTGVPDGALLSAGTENADGSWSLNQSDLIDLTITPPENSDTDFELGLSITATDSNGSTATSTAVLPVTVRAVADTPILDVSPAQGDEDTVISLNITTALTDLDGSETLSSITFTNVPDGALFSAGSQNSDGSWTVNADQLENLSITPPANSDVDFSLNLSVTAMDSDGMTTTTEATLPISLTAVADSPVLEVAAAKGDEDTAITLDISSALTDLDGSETLSPVTINDMPDGALLSSGINNNDGSWTVDASQLKDLTITPPENSDVDFVLGLSVTATDTNGVTATRTASLPVTVSAVADAPLLDVKTAKGKEDSPIDLDISTSLTDLDGSETLSSVTFTGIPEGATLSAGTANPDGSWTITSTELDGLQITPPANSDQDFELGLSITATDTNGSTKTSTVILPVTVMAIVDTPTLEVADAKGREDTAIDLDIKSALTDTDGSESLIISVSGVPEGANLSAGIDNQDGTWTLTQDQLDNLQIEPPVDSDQDFKLDIRAVSSEAREGGSQEISATINVGLTAVADAPTLSVSDANGLEDTAIDLDIKSALTDSDGSESLIITVSGIPEGANLSAGIDNQDGTWTLNQEQLEGLQIKAPENSDQDFKLEVTATSSEARDGDTASTTATINVGVTGVADAPVLQADEAQGYEDKEIALDIKAALTDLDGSETLSVITFTGIPEGATLSAGKNNEDGTWSVEASDLEGLTITPPEDSDTDFVLGLSVTATDTNNVSVTTETELPVTIAAVADGPAVKVEDTSGSEDQAIALSIGGSTTDRDGSESIQSITVADVPEGATLSAGTDNSDGTWSLEQADLEGLTITAPENSNEDFDLRVTYVSVEPNGSSASTTETIGVQVTGVADTPVASFDDLKIAEDQSFTLDFSDSLQDTDGSETLSVTFSNIPEGGKFNSGSANADGSWTIEGNDLNNVQFTPPVDSKESFTLNLVATATENDSDTASTSDSFSVLIDPRADDASFTVKPAMGLEDTAIDLFIGDLKLTDTSGSEIMLPDIIISDVPSGAQLSAGINNNDGSWTLTEDQLDGLQITPPADSNEDFQIKVSVFTQETSNQDTKTTTQTLDIAVTGVSDGTVISTEDSSGKEDSAIALNIETSLIDTDGSETLTLTVGNMPTGAKLNHGEDNGDGTWTVQADDIEDLTVTPPKHFSGTMDLAITSIATENDGHSVSQTDTITISVNAVADTAWIAGGAQGSEDTAIDLNLSSGLRDRDGSETYGAITLSGVPEGYTISGGIDNGDGSFSLTHDQLDGLCITPPKDSNEDVSLTLTVETIDENGDSATASKTIKVDVVGVADAPLAAAANVTGIEDKEIALELDVIGENLGLTDTDGSETLSVVISNVPKGTSFSAGTDNGDGTWSVQPDEVADLVITPPQHFSGTMELNMEATATENDGHSSTTTVPFSVTVTPVIDTPELNVDAVKGNEDTAINLNIDSGLVDTDGSESFSMVIENVPEGATLSAGTDNGDGSWTLTEGELAGLKITPPNDSDTDFSLKLTATTTEKVTGESSTVSSDMTVTVNAVADAPVLDTSDVRGEEDSTFDLDISSALTDTDGSESLLITVNGVPKGASLSAGTENPDGSWTLEQDQLTDLQITPPADSDTDFTLTVTATSTEGTNKDQAVSTSKIKVTLDAVTDAPDLTVTAAAGDEDTKIDLQIDSKLTDTDGSETLVIIIDDVPADVRFSAGQQNADGSWTFVPADLDGLQVTPAPDSDADFTLTIKAVATEKATGQQTITSQSLPVSVTAVADTPLLKVQSINATEDAVIDLQITSSLTDTDGSESLTVTITGIPEGAELSAGTKNADGSYTLTADQLHNLQLTPPADSDVNFALTVTATSTESSNADTASQSYSLPITLFADPDNLQVSLKEAAAGNEDTAIDLQIDASLIDSDGSEIVSITMEGIPVGAELSAGTDNGDGTWTLNTDQLNDLTITPPKDSDQDFNLTLSATTMELANGQEQTTTIDIPVAVAGVADELNISNQQSNGTEDQEIFINLDLGLQDTDGSESLQVTISNIPPGVTLSAGTENSDGSYTLTSEEFSSLSVTPPTNDDSDFSLTITATNTEAEGDSRTSTFIHVVNVAADADKPELTVQSATGAEDTDIAININPGLTDTDGSESLSIIIDDLPTGATLSAGTENNDGSWTLNTDQLEGLTLTPAADSDADFNLKVTARSTESENSDTADTTTFLPVTISAVTDAPELSASLSKGDEDSSISLHIDAALTDTDGSESLSLLIEGVPEGAILSAGSENTDGTWSISQADIADLSILPPKDSNENFELTITAISAETRGGITKSEPVTLPVEVTGVADTPDLTVKGTTGNENSVINLDIQSALTDTEGSESLFITIGGLPENASLSAGTANIDGTWTLTPDELADLKLHPAANSDEDFELIITATTTENDGDSSSISYQLPVNVNGVADAPIIVAGAVSGDEDQQIDLDLSISPVDLDGSEEDLQILVKDVPEGAQLSAGINHGDGTWSVTQDEVNGLKITAPDDSAEDFTLTFEVQSTEKKSGHTTLTSFVVPVTIAAIADGMILKADNAYGYTDEAIALNIQYTALDEDGSEKATFVVTDLPNGATLSAGTENTDGSWSLSADEVNGLQITPPAGSNDDFTITITGTSTEDENGNATSSTISVPVHFRTGGGTGTNAISTNEDTPVKVNIADRIPHVATAVDATITINGVPEGAVLSAGVKNSDGSWTVTQSEIADLALTPAENSGSNLLLSFEAELTDAQGVTSSEETDLVVYVTDVADAPELTVQPTAAEEHTSTELDISANLIDSDGSEQLSITISDMPEGASLSAGTDNGDGSWTLDQSQLNGLRITPPRYSDEDFILTVTATTTEQENGSTASSSFDLPVTVTGMADQPLLAVKSGVGEEDQPISLTIDPQLTDTDGSETLTVTISDIPDGSVLSAGTLNNDGSYTLTTEQLENLTITPPAQSGLDFNLTITATTVETGSGDTSQSVRSLPVIVNAIADALQVSTKAVSSDEDQAIALGLSPTVIDTDGSEVTSIVADNVPTGAILSAGTRNDDGTWSLTTEELEGLQVTPAAQSDDDFEITFTATTVESENGHTTTSEFSVPISINAVVDGVAITSGTASGLEDTAIDLDLSAALADQDGSESHVVTISDVPDGVTLSAGTDNGDGSWTLSPAQLNGLKVIPVADNDTNFNLTLSTSSTEIKSGETSTTTYDIPVNVTAVADSPILQASSDGGKENEAIELNIATALTDIDGSEHLTGIVISGVPQGATLSNGTENQDGSWSLTSDQLDNLTITPPANSGENFSLTITSTSEESTGDTASSSVGLVIQVEAVATDPVVIVSDAAGLEDQNIALDIHAVLADTDGSENITISIAGVPEGARLSAGLPNTDGSWTISQDELEGLSIRPAKDSGDDFDLTITTTSTEANGDTSSTTTILPVTVQAIADTPGLQLNANAAGTEDSAIAIDISAKLTDTDGSETLSVTIEDVPDGAVLSAGTKNSDGSWTVSSDDISGLTITPPAGSDSNFELKITATATEAEGDTAESTSFVLPVNIEAVADKTVFASYAQGAEDTAINLNLSVELTDTDGSELMSAITISGVPEGATLSAGEENADGSWTVRQDQLDGLQITPPADSADNFNLNIKVTTTEQASGTATTSNYSLPVNVTGVADAPVITASAVTGDEDTAIALNIETSLTDTDGSETLSDLTISGVPEGTILSAGSNNHDGSWTVSSDQLQGLTLTPPPNSNDDFILSLSTVSVENEGGTATTSTTVDIVVSPVNDNPDAVNNESSTMEDTALTLQTSDLLVNDSDVDGDTLSITSVQDAEHGTITLNSDATVTFTPDANYTGEASFSYTVSDGKGGSDTAQVRLNITSVNDVPIIEVVDTTATEDTAQVLANISDIDGTIDSNSLTAEHGTVTLAENGDITYSPDENYNGTDTVTITVTDNDGATNTQSITVDIAAVNDAPVAIDDIDSLSTLEDTQLTIDADTLLANDADIDGDTLSITSVQDAEHGTVAITNDGSVTFTPDADYNGDASFTYTVSDGKGGSDTAKVNLKVDAVDDSVSIITDTDANQNAVDENAATGSKIGITASATDIDAGSTVSYSLVNDADGRFAIDAESGEITVADGTKLDHESDDLHLISIKATSSDGSSSTKNLAVTVNDVVGETIISGSGDDTITGGSGTDTVIFSGNESEYNIVKTTTGSYIVQDSVEDRDGDDTITDVEQFQFADKTVAADDLTLSSKLIDGAVEGIEYSTTSGLHGFTDKTGGFDFKDGDDVTFTVGGVILGTATAEDVATGQTFLQDVADVERTDLNDEYLENMATFLQSIDENSNAYDGIVVTDEIREALADVTLDLRTATEEEIQAVVEQIGQVYVSEDAAMAHVEDMLVAHTDLEHDDFEEHLDDNSVNLEQSLSAEQKKADTSSVVSSAAAGITAGAAIQTITDADSSDLSLSLPTLSIPGEEQQEEDATQEPEIIQPEKQELTGQNQVEIADTTTNADEPQADSISTDVDLFQSLPSASLSNLFEEPASPESDENEQFDTSRETEKSPAQSTVQTVETATTDSIKTENSIQEEATVETVTIEESTAETVIEDELETEDELLGDEISLSTDNLSIDLEEAEMQSESQDTDQQGDNDLDRFIADGRTEQIENDELEDFLANDTSSSSSEEMPSVEDIDNTEEENDVQVEDANLSADDGIPEELPQETEPVEHNG